MQTLQHSMDGGKMTKNLNYKARQISEKKNSIHDGIVNKLEKRIRQTTIGGEDYYSDIIKFEEYGPYNHRLGEVDLQAYNNDYFLFFEIKSHHTRKNRKKAKEQLSRAEEYYVRNFNRKRTFKFYVAGKRIEWIK